MEQRTKLLIGGAWTEGHDRFETINPATEQVIAEVKGKVLDICGRFPVYG